MTSGASTKILELQQATDMLLVFTIYDRIDQLLDKKHEGCETEFWRDPTLVLLFGHFPLYGSRKACPKMRRYSNEISIFAVVERRSLDPGKFRLPTFLSVS